MIAGVSSPATAAPRLYLVDGTSQLFRAFYAIRGLSNKDGLPTNAVYGFTTMLRKLLKEERPRWLGVAFDLPGPTFRHERYEAYKAHRPPTPQDLNVQVPWAKEVCAALHIPILELAGRDAVPYILDIARAFERWAAETTLRDGFLPRVVGMHATRIGDVAVERVTTPYTMWMVQRVVTSTAA